MAASATRPAFDVDDHVERVADLALMARYGRSMPLWRTQLAVACDWIGKNPCAGVRLPLAGSKVKRTILTSQQVAASASRLEEPYSGKR